MPTLLVITGPTASGKTDEAIRRAKELNCPIISADSRQIFRGMEIGTAQPTPAQLAEVQHFMIGIKDVTEYFSAYEFEQEVLKLLTEIFQKNQYAILCGGSMMYIDAVINGIDEIPTISPQVREAVYHEYEEKGAEAMLEKLETLDPQYYDIVDHCNTKRILHALEIIQMAGTTYTELRRRTKVTRPFDIEKSYIDLPREILYQRIDKRVDQMIEAGLEAEARKLERYRHINALNTVGYKELFDYFDHKYDLPEAIRLIKRNTRHYAKKQITWFKNHYLCKEKN